SSFVGCDLFPRRSRCRSSCCGVVSSVGVCEVVESSWLVEEIWVVGSFWAGNETGIGNALWARFGSGAEGTSCWIEVRRSPFFIPELPTPSPAYGVLVLGQFEIVRTRSAERSGVWLTRSNPIEGALSIALGWIPRGRLPVLGSSRFCIGVATSGGLIGRSIEVQRLLLLLVPMLIVARVVGVNHAFNILVGHCQLR
ncbi:hypothetical protein PIB30_081694, partial [Stylosanthes scabra]|nr:hypothetical protein [Stylosanthes scabra]